MLLLVDAAKKAQQGWAPQIRKDLSIVFEKLFRIYNTGDYYLQQNLPVAKKCGTAILNEIL